MRKVKLGLPVNANENAVKNVLKSKGLKPYQELDWDVDVDVKALIARAVPHTIYQEGVAKVVKVKLETLEVEIDDLGYVIAYIYEES